jgi:hypothetical protein
MTVNDELRNVEVITHYFLGRTEEKACKITAKIVSFQAEI